MHRVVISGTGLFVAPQSIGNEELVDSYNTCARQFNAANAARIEAGELARLEESSVEFIEKASGIKRRSVMEKEGILDPQRMRPKLQPRPDSELFMQAGSIVAFHNHSSELAAGDVGVICSFGAGYSIGSVVVKKV